MSYGTRRRGLGANWVHRGDPEEGAIKRDQAVDGTPHPEQPTCTLLKSPSTVSREVPSKMDKKDREEQREKEIE